MFFYQKYKSILAVLISIVLYFMFAYNLDRTHFIQLLLLYLGLFIPFFYCIRKEKNNFWFLAGAAILFRLVFLFAFPNLSQDFYRFIWDGRMILEGYNPYISLPETFIQERNFPIKQAAELYAGMGALNGSHYTNYPPLNQLHFFIAALFSGKSILGATVVLRFQIMLADIGILYFGKKILEKLQLPVHHIFLYVLNPFIIIEMTGNLHFEPVMLFFLVWSMYLLFQKKWVWAAVILGLSVSVKLIPLLFLPLFFQWFASTQASGNNRKKWVFFTGVIRWVLFCLLVILVNLLLFLPFLSSDLIHSYTSSVGLWFGNFEFNASIYYITREIGYLFRGWNEIAIIGKIMPLLTILFLVIITFFRKNKTQQQLLTALLFGVSFYYFTTTTMHPWYLGTLVLISVFTRYRFPLVWSVVIILSYQAYTNTPWQENLWCVGLEYLIVYGVLVYEILTKKSCKFPQKR